MERKIDLEAIMIVGRVISANTIPPTSGVERGRLKKFKKIERPRSPNTIEGTCGKVVNINFYKGQLKSFS
jgi:hypothetical protein